MNKRWVLFVSVAFAFASVNPNAWATGGVKNPMVTPGTGNGNTTVLNKPVNCPNVFPASAPAPTSGGIWNYGGNGKDLPWAPPGTPLSSSSVNGSGGGGKANLLWCGYFKKDANQQSTAESYLVFSCGKSATAPVMPSSASSTSVVCP